MDEQHTHETYVDTIIRRKACSFHRAIRGAACYAVPSGVEHGKVFYGVCDKRARSAGFVGFISATALRRK